MRTMEQHDNELVFDKKVYVGIDVHKESWHVTIRTLGEEVPIFFMIQLHAFRLTSYLAGKLNGKPFTDYRSLITVFIVNVQSLVKPVFVLPERRGDLPYRDHP
jgi:hypothetical protein